MMHRKLIRRNTRFGAGTHVRRPWGAARVTAWLSLALLPLAAAPLPGIPSVSPPNALFYIFALMAIGSMLISGRFKRCWVEPGSYILVALVLWMLVSSALNGGQTALISNVITGVGAVVFYFVGIYLAYGDSPGWRWETAIFVGALVAAIVGLLHYTGVLPLFSFEKLGVAARTVAGFEFSNRGYKGLINASGNYDIWMLAGIMVAHRWLIRSGVKRWLKLFSVVAAIVMIVADVVSQSRSGWLTIAVFLIVYWLGLLVLRERSPRRRGYFIGVVISLLIAIVGLLLISRIGQDVARVLVSAQSATVFGRLSGYAQAIAEIGLNPVFGAGKFWTNHNGLLVLVHSTPLAYAANNGILAGILFVLFFVRALYWSLMGAYRSSSTVQREDFLSLFAALLGAAIAINLFPGIGSKFLFALLGCISGVLLTYSRRRVRNKLIRSYSEERGTKNPYAPRRVTR